ncbi:MAG: 4-oxalocrotonate tautomerase [Promethearchaeota archaeon CR_4]|nr:MAG: 4-oxalocrotonate tautomerase [Candidatus Lokiarchaeota archaeon CR_4]
MPLVKIEIVGPKDEAYKKAVLDGVHEALVHALKVPVDDRTQRLYVLGPENFEYRSGRTDQFTLIEILLFAGRSKEAKKKLYSRIVENLKEQPGIASKDILIVLNEQPLENWGVHGGKPADEVDLGFNIKV